MKIIKEFNNGGRLFYDKGNFDKWCIFYECEPREVKKFAPTDKFYFKHLLDSSKKYITVYDDLMDIFHKTTNEFDEKILHDIEFICQKYGEDALQIEITFIVVYCGMIAEEKKANTKLGKRIKMLGIHQLLKENFGIDEAADFSRGKGWRILDEECKKYGF
ncbi:DUF7004 family protein [Chryseobacterium oryctis]|uniref:Uncharacterized protein n=1 Tax=Chryseobacterium oryctis TaxID=2952618 RepID=A0ABT3HM08_9FLAO|nr:hypothetical protein [Chryseobacterium oryctis]MCW3160663.1 hypothetical protein [Chryseobacterium oryctis]